jgi:outer membrane protein W
VITSRKGLAWSAALLAGALAANVAFAEDIEKKWRVGITVGSFLPEDKSHSASANSRAILATDGSLFDFVYDPRNDSAAISDFGIRGGYATRLSASYGFNRTLFLEGSVGYRRADVRNVEVQAEFDGTPRSTTRDFQFRIFNLTAGTIQQIPVELTAGLRFRPKAIFNPYVSLGVGYSFNSFQTSSELDTLSSNMDNSVGGFSRLSGSTFSGERLLSPTSSSDLSGITVSVPSAPEWHVGGGFEVSFKKHWVVYLDARYVNYSGKLRMKINNGDELGISVPADRRTVTDPNAYGPFGAVWITTGGLIDGGSLLPNVDAPPGTDCTTDPGDCSFTGPPDGVPDPGKYYVHAGNVRFDGLDLQVGVRFTF